jgi:seryl-tRNA synthetase
VENELVAEILLSGSPGTRADLDPLIPALVEDAFRRTLGTRGTGRLAEWAIDGDRLTLRLESDGGRPHQALLATVRKLGEELGRGRKVGVRSFRAPRYRVRFPVGAAAGTEIALALPHSLELGGEHATLELLDLSEEALRDNWIDRAIQLVQEKAKRQGYEGKEQYWSLLGKTAEKAHPGRTDPTEEMIRRNWVRGGPTKGKWFLGPTAAHLLRTMERIARTEVLEPLGFREVVQPHHDSFDILLKTGHLEGLPGEFYYVAEPTTRDPKAWERFTDLVAITRKVPTDELGRLVGPPSAISCYAQCPTIYWWLSGRTIATESLPVKIFDRTAISNRYESGGRHGLERVDEFHRIEPVYLGTPDQLLELREALRARYAHVFDDILDLEWRTAWVTPFYLQQSGGVGVEDAENRVKGTIDYEAYLPYRGDRATSEWLEFQNLSIVGDKYTRAFTIRAQKGEIWSGCSGIGLERWLSAFLAQKGLDPKDWPSGFRDRVGKLPDEVRFL